MHTCTYTPIHIMVKFQNTKEKEKILKAFTKNKTDDVQRNRNKRANKGLPW